MDPSGSNGHSTPSAGGNAAAAGAHDHLTEAQRATLQLLYYVELLRSRWLLIVSLTIGIGLGYGLYTKFLTVKWFRAQAIVTPVQPDEGMSLGTSAEGDMVGGLGGGIAEVQSDFAFKVVEPPVVPDNYFEPKARHNATVASSITFVLVCTWILAAIFIRRAKAKFAAMNPAPAEPASDDPSPRPDEG